MSMVLIMMLSACGRKAEVSDYAIIPEPLFLSQKAGYAVLDRSLSVHLENLGQNSNTAKMVYKTLRKMYLHPSFSGRAEGNDMTFSINMVPNEEIGDEGYLLEVSTSGIHISANTETGLFYGFVTFCQMLPVDIGHQRYKQIRLACCTILDYPRFSWRGSSLDVSSHFYSVKQIKRHLDIMAQYKLNKFHWHLTGDHGWRIEIEKYPELTEIGAWRPSRDGVDWYEAEPPRPDEECDYGGFYSKEEIAEIVEYAALRHIEVIPEITLPNHCSPVLAAYPELSCDGGHYAVQVGPYWPDRAILCAGNDSVLAFMRNVLTEVAEMFPGEYIHIGGGEMVFDNWSECPLCQSRMRQLGLAEESVMLDWLVAQLDTIVAPYGKHLVGWEELYARADHSHSHLAMSWKDVESGLSLAQRGYHVVMCPQDYCNLDYYQAQPSTQPTAMGRENTLRHTYNFDPMPSGTNALLSDLVVGGQCNLSTEFISTQSESDYMLYPRMMAVAECLWSARENRDWFNFRRKMTIHRAVLKKNGVEYCPGSFRPVMHRFGLGNGTSKVALESEVANTYIFYTTDGSTPTTNSTIYIDPIQVQSGTVIRTLSVFEGLPREEVYEYHL